LGVPAQAGPVPADERVDAQALAETLIRRTGCVRCVTSRAPWTRLSGSVMALAEGSGGRFQGR
jgi:hypothetical protein